MPQRHAAPMQHCSGPLPQLLPKGKPVCAATVRLGLGFTEVPFFATQETHRRA